MQSPRHIHSSKRQTCRHPWLLNLILIPSWIFHVVFGVQIYGTEKAAQKKAKQLRAGLVAGYIRQSFTQNEDDTASPDRQRTNILEAAKRYDLVPVKFFEDATGHRSGASTKNRPQWCELEALIKDGKVSVLIANDLSRMHRNGWRVGQLIEWLREHHTRLILAAPGREVDVESLMGLVLVHFIALIDEYYVPDASLRA